jgi:hypothetical protein
VGDRRGVEWGYLFYKGRELKSYFETIVIDDLRYDFRIFTEDRTFSGYVENEEYKPKEASTEKDLSREEMKLGWYTAALHERRRGTPDNWVWIKRQNLEAFLNPKDLYGFVKRYKLSTIIEDENEARKKIGFGFSLRGGFRL